MKREHLIFLCLLLLVLIYRLSVFFHFSLVYPDSDQAIMWHAARDFAAGNFHEPRFYGQDYNTMLEALFAVPLIYTGMPVHVALPVITLLMALFPFFLLTFLAYRYRGIRISFIPLAMLLILPAEYTLLSSLPRGFVTGVFVASPCLLLLFRSPGPLLLLTCGFLAAISFSINPNALFLTAFCFTPVLLSQIRKPSLYIYAGSGLLAGLFIHWIIQEFYRSNPGYVVHAFTLEFAWKNLIQALINPVDFFSFLGPVPGGNGYLLPFFLLILAVWSVSAGRRLLAAGFFLVLLAVIISLGFNKIHDGLSSVYFSSARMFLAVPVLFAVGLTFLLPDKKITTFGISLIGLAAGMFQLYRLPAEIHENINREHLVSVHKFSEVQKVCNKIARFADAQSVDLVVIVDHPMYDFINYGCPAIEADFPPTLRPSAERRRWRIKEEENTSRETILFLDARRSLSSPQLDKHPADSAFFVIRDNRQPVFGLMNDLENKQPSY